MWHLLPGGPQPSMGRELTCTIITHVGQAATAGYGGSVWKGHRGPQVDQPAGARRGVLVSPACKCRRYRSSLLVVLQGMQVAGKPSWRSRAEP